MTQKKILIVEDDPDLVRLLEIFISQLDFRILVASDIDDSLILARRELPAMILLDISLPSGSGMLVLEQLQKPPCAYIPVVIISAHDPEGYEPVALAAGAIAYLQKPVDFVRLEHLLKPLQHDNQGSESA